MHRPHALQVLASSPTNRVWLVGVPRKRQRRHSSYGDRACTQHTSPESSYYCSVTVLCKLSGTAHPQAVVIPCTWPQHGAAEVQSSCYARVVGADEGVGWVLGKFQLGRHGCNLELTSTLAIFWSVVKMMMMVVVMAMGVGVLYSVLYQIFPWPLLVALQCHPLQEATLNPQI